MAAEKRLFQDAYYLFNQGELYHSYLFFGAHLVTFNKMQGVCFTVWASNASTVSVVGNFNCWRGEAHQMERQGSSGVWRLFVPGLQAGEVYKYEIVTALGERFLKADPFAFGAERRPQTASIVCDLSTYTWQDQSWCSQRNNTALLREPFLIYEVHLGSWKRKDDGSFYTYRDLARELIPYVIQMGFTHIELLPVMEHPFDGSWGYQITEYYAATSRYGSPEDLMYLIDCCHQAGIGVILDWVPGHFCKDAQGLSCFDGTALFEAEENMEWGTYEFNFARKEVWSFLISNALFWLDIYHVDGLRVDGVTSMLLLNYGNKGTTGRTNRLGGNENLEAAAFLRTLNRAIFHYHPHAIMMAEESTAWPLVTRPCYDGGLGFNYKWNMGWMNDTLRYMSTPFEWRSNAHHLLTFSLIYAFSENFILPLSHDEVVHGKLSLLNRMPGNYWQKFAGLRLLHLYWICHPGKKLLFMGGEIGQFIEWQDEDELDWFLSDYEAHRKHKEFVRDANCLYLKETSLWQQDNDWHGFEWMDVDNREQSVLSFLRWSRNSGEFLLIVLNFLPQHHENYCLGVPVKGDYQEVFTSDSLEYGGAGWYNPEPLSSEANPWHGYENSICFTLPALGGIILKKLPA